MVYCARAHLVLRKLVKHVNVRILLRWKSVQAQPTRGARASRGDGPGVQLKMAAMQGVSYPGCAECAHDFGPMVSK